MINFLTGPKHYISRFLKQRFANSRLGRAQILHRPDFILPHSASRTTQGSAYLPNSVIERICNAFNLSGGSEGNAGESMWSTFASKNADLISALKSYDLTKVNQILSHPELHEHLYGMDSIAASLLSGPTRFDPDWLALQAADKMIRLGEAIGLVRCHYPESYPFARPNPIDIAPLLGQFDLAFGFSVKFPTPYAGEIGLATERGVASVRPIEALYQAWRLRDLVGPGHRVLEIGAGLGRTALYAYEFGLPNYTIVDLPLTAVCQAHFLFNVLGPETVSLQGEERKRIHIASPAAFLEGQLGNFDLVLNVDSFPEMDVNFIQAYWRAIKECTPIFLSINHEFNNATVRQLIAGDPQVCRSSRSPYWMRRGYVEETAWLK